MSLASSVGVTLRQLRRDCAHKRAEYLIARQIHAEVTRLAVPDRTALEVELRDALIAYYGAHGALHEMLRRREANARLH